MFFTFSAIEAPSIPSLCILSVDFAVLVVLAILYLELLDLFAACFKALLADANSRPLLYLYDEDKDEQSSLSKKVLETKDADSRRL